MLTQKRCERDVPPPKGAIVESRRLLSLLSLVRRRSCRSLDLKTLRSSETPETVSSSVCRVLWWGRG